MKVEFLKEYSAIYAMGAFAEFERSLIRERQLEGIAIARQAGAYKGRKREMTEERIAEIKQRAAAGEKKAVIARDMKISRETLYQYEALAKVLKSVIPAGFWPESSF